MSEYFATFTVETHMNPMEPHLEISVACEGRNEFEAAHDAMRKIAAQMGYKTLVHQVTGTTEEDMPFKPQPAPGSNLYVPEADGETGQ